MRVISANLNGIRSAQRKGFFQWLEAQAADVVAIQETKAQESQLQQHADAAAFYPEGFHCYYFDAEKKGYSGVALYCRQKPKRVSRGLGWAHCDSEGRYIQADFDTLSVASMYLPSGSSSEQRHSNKLDFMQQLLTPLQSMRRKRRQFIVCGDWNTVHKEIDIRNWKANQKNSGCTPQERAWLDTVFDELGFVDAFREVEKGGDLYTWWSNRGQAWANNVGWRIDYQVITPGLRDCVRSASIYREQRFSDHAPLTIDYDFPLI